MSDRRYLVFLEESPFLSLFWLPSIQISESAWHLLRRIRTKNDVQEKQERKQERKQVLLAAPELE